MTAQKVAILSPGIFTNSLLGEGKTNAFGKFDIPLTVNRFFTNDFTNLILKVFEETVPSETSRKEREVASHSFVVPSATKTFDVGDIKVNLYEAQAKLPALDIPSDSSKRPQQQTLAFYKELLFSGVYKVLNGLRFSVLEKWTTIKDVVAAFPPKGKPIFKLEPSSTVELVLNGLYPCHFRQGAQPDELVNEINWDKYDKDPSPDLPNATLTLKKVNGSCQVSKVEVKYPNEPVKTYDASSKEIGKALYLFNSMALLKGEAVYHLGIGHLITGQIALSFFRHVNNHPIKKFLEPHLDGVAEINLLGSGLIFGQGGILNVSGLSSKGVDQVLEDTLAAFDPATFHPRAPITENHLFAKAQLLFWDVVSATVDRFFAENQKAISSADNWFEIFDMSKHLTNNSLPYKPFDSEGIMKDAPWNDPSEFDSPSLNSRVEHDGKLRAIRPITTSREAPQAGDIERLKQFCRYTLFLSTFYHWAIHSSQYQWMTNLEVGSLAPESHAEKPFGGTNPMNAVRQLQVASVLVDFEAQPLVKNPFGVIYQPFIDNIMAKREEFSKLNYDITKMHYGVII